MESNWDPWLFDSSGSSEHQLQNNAAINPIYLIVQAKGLKSSHVTVENQLNGHQSSHPRATCVVVLVNHHHHPRSKIRSEGGEYYTLKSPSSASSEDGSTYNYNTASPNAASLLTTPPVSSTTSTKASAKGGGGGFGFLKSGFKKAQASIERSVEQTVTAIAYRADNGKNPDLVCASLHYCGMNNDTLTNGKM